MLCDTCGVRVATIHKTATNADVSTVNGKAVHIRHYCTTCFERMSSKKVEPTEDFGQEPKTPITPVF